MSETFDRLFQAAKEIRGVKTKADLGRMLNASAQTLTNWETRGVSSQGLIDAAAILDLSAAWLTTGKGDMTGSQQVNTNCNVGNQNNVSGSNTINNFLPTESEHSGSLKKIIMPDNAMLPTFPQGSELTIDTRQTHLIDGKIYQIQSGERFFIRKVFTQISGSLKLVCDNPEFESGIANANDVQIIGRVIEWRVRD